MDNEDIHELAKQAVENMAEKYPSDFTFPFDLIWQYVADADSIPSERRSDKWRKLNTEGYIEPTGGMTKAVSAARAGSPTREYRFGLHFRPPLEASVTPLATDENISGLLAALQTEMEREGYYVSVAELANFYLAMAVSPLVILSGISGTGKSLLPRKFANLTGALFHSIPVQPQWADNTDLFGYVPTLSPTHYKPGKIIPAINDARENPDTLTIALLDEMNLAPVEHYFSDFLSVAETRSRTENGTISSDVLPIELPAATTDEAPEISVLRGLMLPANLRIVGTANMDETTHSFSPKVLDRTFAIEFDDPDLTVFTSEGVASDLDFTPLALRLTDVSVPISVLEVGSDSQALFEHVSSLLSEIQAVLSPAGIKFGYRTRDSILLYLHNWHVMGLQGILSANAAMDFCILQKVLPKVSGVGDALSDVLGELAQWLGKERAGSPEASPLGFNAPFERSRQKVERMKRLLDSDGATHFWGV